MNPVEQALQTKRAAFEAAFQPSQEAARSSHFSSELAEAVTSQTSTNAASSPNTTDLSYQMARAKEVYDKLLQGVAAPPASIANQPAAEKTATSSSTDDRFQPISAQNEGKYQELIAKAAATYNVPEALIKRIIEVESGFNPNAVSSAGATGLMQLMYGTNRTDPETNIMQGTKQLAGYIKQYDGDLSLALAAYNAGPGNVKKYGGVPPFKETIQYIDKILAK
ncbi:lytic transglycosylase domain-containing protein [Listeria costaricensis]|uniref:lytic transglycosylase domain-containing protein n=1 Tax=Listeria costaricensis TaxID=2026604 RepID=UPI000C08B98C|nr:lytic transglycosylase domain-containing protein [Listeria costaricensis]